MVNYKKILAVAAGVVITVSSMGVSFADTTFTDVPSDFWSYKYVSNVAENNMMPGFEDGTFRPNETASKLETIVGIYKGLKEVGYVKESELAVIVNTHKELIQEGNIPAMLSPYGGEIYSAVAFALEKKIITASDLSTFMKNGKPEPVNKMEASIFVGKALGLVKETKKSIISFSYKDLSDIEMNAIPYIDALIKNGIISESGDAYGNFNPKQILNRSILATIESGFYDSIEWLGVDTPDDGTDFYIAVDQSTMGGTAIVEPAAVHVDLADYSTTTVLDLLGDVKGSVTVHDNYGYVDYMSSSFSDSYDFDIDYDGTLTNPCTDSRMVFTDQSDGLLTEKEFTGVSGWMMQIDSQTSGTYQGDTVWYSGNTTVQDLINTGLLDASDTSATIRWYYSLNMGADMGLAYSSWLPTSQPIYDNDLQKWVYDWSQTQYTAPSFTMANKDALVEALAESPSDQDYTSALVMFNKVDATQAEVDSATASLN